MIIRDTASFENALLKNGLALIPPYYIYIFFIDVF